MRLVHQDQVEGIQITCPLVDRLDPGDDADLYPEVCAGRAPVSTVDEARVFVDKTIAYDVLRHRKLLMTRAAVEAVEARLGEAQS